LVLAAGLQPASVEAKRIVALAPSITETLFAVGAGDEVVGVSDLSDYPTEARRITRVGSYLKPNVEAVIALRPDLVVAVPSPGNREAVEGLMSLGLHVVMVEEGPTLRDVFAAIESIGVETGRAAPARDLIAQMNVEVESVRRRVANVPRRRVLMIVGQNPLIAVGGENLLDELVRIAGGDNVAAGLGRWPRLSVEFLVKSAPDVIIDSSMGDEAPSASSFYDGLGLKAVAQKRLYAARIDEVLRPGPRVGDGLVKLARVIHPEAFAGATAR
jgi:iron complex transport system substrate-binding protein